VSSWSAFHSSGAIFAGCRPVPTRRWPDFPLCPFRFDTFGEGWITCHSGLDSPLIGGINLATMAGILEVGAAARPITRGFSSDSAYRRASFRKNMRFSWAADPQLVSPEMATPPDFGTRFCLSWQAFGGSMGRESILSRAAVFLGSVSRHASKSTTGNTQRNIRRFSP
jgi:hypothetical protein